MSKNNKPDITLLTKFHVFLCDSKLVVAHTVL